MTLDQLVLLKIFRDAGIPIKEGSKLKDDRAIRKAKRKRYWWIRETAPLELALWRGSRTVAVVGFTPNKTFSCSIYTDWRSDDLTLNRFEAPTAHPDSLCMMSDFIKKYL